jgi:hypothetical protein
MDEQKVISPGAGGKMGGHDELIPEKSKVTGAAKEPYGKKQQGGICPQETV